MTGPEAHPPVLPGQVEDTPVEAEMIGLAEPPPPTGPPGGGGTGDEGEDGGDRFGRAVGSGFAWSLLNNVVGRLGSFLAGIVVVRQLSESEFGVYGVAMVVLAVLLSMNELGVSVAVVQRRGSVDDIAPTVVTISVGSSMLLAVIAFAAAPALASAMQAPEATWLIRLLVLSVVIDGFAAVPNALITRAMQQRKRLVIDSIAFVVGTPVTIALAFAGYGAWSLGWGALIGNLTTGVLSLAWAPGRYRPGWNRAVLPELMKFGLPLAGASLLLFLMMNVDYIVVGHLLGPVELGLYLLAFNMASWPTTVIGAAIRRVTLAAFSRMSENDADGGSEGFSRIVGLVLAVTVPVCAMLALFAYPTLELLYGERWTGAADALRLLVIFSLGRIAVELTYDFLAASGNTRFTVWLHGAWLLALVPAVVVGAKANAITGVALAHALVVLVVLLPLLAYLLKRSGIRLRRLARHSMRPLLGAVAIAVPSLLVLREDWPPIVLLLVGGVLGGLAYLAVVWPMRRSAMELWNTSH